MIQALKRDTIQQFIAEHLQKDTHQLALKYEQVDGVPIHLILDQIKARQKALKKWPEPLLQKGIIFPPPLSVEQSSSQKTAKFKSTIMPHGKHFLDLTKIQ